MQHMYIYIRSMDYRDQYYQLGVAIPRFLAPLGHPAQPIRQDTLPLFVVGFIDADFEHDC